MDSSLHILVYEAKKLTGAEIEVALQTFDLGIVKVDVEGKYEQKEHQFSDIPLSRIYFEFRTPEHPHKPGKLTPELCTKIGRVLVRSVLQKRIHFDAIVGIPDAGTVFVDAFAKAWKEQTQEMALRLRLIKTGEGKERFISGIEENPEVPRGSRVLLFDDLIAHGRSKKEAVIVLRKNLYSCTDISVLLDRREGGVQELDEMGVVVHAVNTIHQYLGVYLLHHKMTVPQIRAVLAQIPL